MPRRPDNWPPDCLPRGLDVAMAAYYVGLSPGTFLERVRHGVYPHALEIGRRKVWGRAALDDAMDRLSGRTGNAASDAHDEALYATMQRRFRAGRQSEEGISSMHLAGRPRRETRTDGKKADQEGAAEPPTLEAMQEWLAIHRARDAKNAAVDNDPAAIERILAAHRAGDATREIAAREGLTGSKVNALIRKSKRRN